MPESAEYAQCPTCRAVFNKKTLYRTRENKDPSEAMGCINHLDRSLGSDRLAKEIRKGVFAEREKELHGMKSAKFFANWEPIRTGNYRSYVHSLYAENKSSREHANHLFSYTLLKKSLESDITMIFFEITQKGLPLDIIDEMGFHIFSETKNMIEEYAPQGVVDSYGPSSQITLISPGTFEDFKDIDKVIEKFNKSYSPSRRLFAVGFDYNLAERPQEQLKKLHTAMRTMQDVNKITERAARAS